ncbi:biotin transporter BioY [Corynebacterium ulceribovis]|uniref:biotin transporter BioY n=1 Tax=Corynebacterium ulceribovis TaxID=487732 RepID=UPI00036FBD76|nr:biotin transporter BioY [Corynebacterium ulceribovis]
MKQNTVTGIALVAAFAALIIALGAVSIPVGAAGVPIVLQNMGILLAAFILGWKRGALAIVTVLVLGLVGIPVLAGWRTTLSALPGPTTGYLVGYILAAVVAGLISATAIGRSKPIQITVFIAAGLLAAIVQYFCGAVWLTFRFDMGFWQAFWFTNLPFALGDTLKAVAAALTAVAVLAAVPDLRTPKN